MEMSCDGNDELEHGDVCIEGGDVEQHRLYRSLAMLRQQLHQTAEASKASAITHSAIIEPAKPSGNDVLSNSGTMANSASAYWEPPSYAECRAYVEPQALNSKASGTGRNEMPCFSKVVYLQAQPGCTPALDSVSGPRA